MTGNTTEGYWAVITTLRKEGEKKLRGNSSNSNNPAHWEDGMFQGKDILKSLQSI
jgi:hypothetical protein